jgi:hypothetical protein
VSDNPRYVKRHVQLRCWLARLILGKHGSVIRQMTEAESKDYIRRSMQAEIDWLKQGGEGRGRAR